MPILLEDIKLHLTEEEERANMEGDQAKADRDFIQWYRNFNDKDLPCFKCSDGQILRCSYKVDTTKSCLEFRLYLKKLKDFK